MMLPEEDFPVDNENIEISAPNSSNQGKIKHLCYSFYSNPQSILSQM